MAAVSVLNALTTRAPGRCSATTALDGLPPRSKGANPAGPIDAAFIASMTMRPFQGGRSETASGWAFHGTARNTMSAVAASCRDTALIPGPRSRRRDEREPESRLLLIDAAMRALDSLLATAWPMWPAPIIPIVMVLFSAGSVSPPRHTP